MHDRNMHEYWFIIGVVDLDKVHEEAMRRSIQHPDTAYVVHKHTRGKCKPEDECVTYIAGEVHDGKVRVTQLQK